MAWDVCLTERVVASSSAASLVAAMLLLPLMSFCPCVFLFLSFHISHRTISSHRVRYDDLLTSYLFFSSLALDPSPFLSFVPLLPSFAFFLSLLSPNHLFPPHHLTSPPQSPFLLTNPLLSPPFTTFSPLPTLISHLLSQPNHLARPPSRRRANQAPPLLLRCKLANHPKYRSPLRPPPPKHHRHVLLPHRRTRSGPRRTCRWR